MITDSDVAHFAGYITGHPDTPPDAQHRAAARAVLEGLDREGRLAQAAWWATGRPISPDLLLMTVVGAVASATGLVVAYLRGWRWTR